MGELSRALYHRLEGASMDHSDLFCDKLEWNCMLDAMYVEDEDDEDECYDEPEY